MSGGGGKGGSQSQEIPKYLERASKDAVSRVQDISKMGYAPYYGPSIAAVNPTERLAAQNAVSGASAFGLADAGHDVYAGMPEPVTMGGVSGYSTAPLFDQAVMELETRAPAYMEAYKGLIDSNLPNDMQGFYRDPNNPEHMDLAQNQYPEGYEWLRFYQNPTGGFL